MGNSIIESKLLPWQAMAANAIISQKCDILLLTGGYGGGKTAVNAQIVLAMALRRAMKGIILATTFSSIKDTVAVTLAAEIPEIILKNTNRQAPYSWVLETEVGRTEITSRTMRYDHEAVPRLRGINADFLWFTEATELPKESFIHAIARLRNSGADAHYPIIMDTNPSSKTNWVYEILIKDSKEIYRQSDDNFWVQEKVIGYDDTGIASELKIWIFNTTTYANPYFPARTLALMKESYSPTELQRLVYGEWNALDGRVWEQYSIFKVEGDLKVFASTLDRIIVGVDPGQDDPTALVLVGFKAGIWYVFDEYVAREKSVRNIHAQLMAMLETWGLKGRYLELWVDPYGLGAQWLKEWHDIPDSLGAFRASFKGTDKDLNMSVRTGELLRNKRLLIRDTCRNVIKDCENAVYTKGIDKRIDKAKHNPHAMDAVGCALSREY